MKTIEAVIENFNFEGVPPWNVSTSDNPFIRLYGGISDDEIGVVMLFACRMLSGEILNDNKFRTLEEFVKDEGFVLEGGLLFKENGKIKVAPGCCCGLENWNEWLDVPFGKCEIWTGHDPESLIELNDGKIKIWQDRSLKNEVESIEFTVDELIKGLKNVKKDLTDFLHRLGQWTKFIKPGLENQVVSHFAKSMNIK
ncbi:MAG: hypothetical protein K1X72_01830 [Pyrinomonadaceae bacterium]|nr:hypothetical protein [Pyrinomonadaceae bacterium]